jgi:hypothetical protein
MANHATPQLTADEITEAWVYLLGRYLVIRQERIDLAEDGVDYNVLKHNPAIAAGTSSEAAPMFVNPNLDVVYSETWFAVDEDTPAILEIPEIPDGLYYTAQIVDEWAEITHNINERNFPHHPHGQYAICLAGSNATIPDGCERVDIPSTKAKLLTRVQIGTDLARAVNLQHQFTVSSAGQPTVTPIVEFDTFTNAELPGAAMFGLPQLDGALAPADACPRADTMHPLIRRIADHVAADQANFEQVDHLIRTTAIPKFMRFVTTFGQPVNGWSSTAAYPKFGDDYWFRATANFGGIWWNSSNEAVYEMLHTDADGEECTGDHSYAMRFEPGTTPDTVVGKFWSLTVYGKPDYMLVPNDLHRYTLGYQSPLTQGDDGSTTLYFGTTLPDGAPESNWLPTPAGNKFTADLRLYLPTQAVTDGTWSPPPVSKI